MIYGCLNLTSDVAYFLQFLIISYFYDFGKDFFYTIKTEATSLLPCLVASCSFQLL